MSERTDDCPNCHMRNLGKSNAQVLEELADELNATERRLLDDVEDSNWGYEAEQLEVEAFTYRGIAIRARAKAKEEA